MSSRPQRTLRAPVAIEGVGLHTGEKGVMRFLPAAVDHGVRFVRTDLPGKPEVRVRPENAHFDPDAGRRTDARPQGRLLVEEGLSVQAADATDAGAPNS